MTETPNTTPDEPSPAKSPLGAALNAFLNLSVKLAWLYIGLAVIVLMSWKISVVKLPLHMSKGSPTENHIVLSTYELNQYLPLGDVYKQCAQNYKAEKDFHDGRPTANLLPEENTYMERCYSRMERYLANATYITHYVSH